MLTQAKVMFLCDVDNTLLDNDRFAAESGNIATDPAPDLTVVHIGELCDLALPDFMPPPPAVDAGRQSPPATIYQEPS